MDDAKREVVRAWPLKGRNDLATARQISDLPDGHLNAATSHRHPGARKAVNGFLTFHDHRLERTDDVERLLAVAAAYGPGHATGANVASLRTPTGTGGKRRRWNLGDRNSRTAWPRQPAWWRT